MITKLTSVKTAIAKVIADLGLQEDDIKISDFREWAGEAIEKIGAIQQFNNKVSGEDGAPILEIKGHQVSLPCNLHKLHQVAYSFNCNGPWYPMRKATGSFSVWGSKDDCDCSKPNMLVKDETLVNLVVDLYGNIDKSEALEMLSKNSNMKTILTNLINDHTVNVDYLMGNTRLNPSMDLQYGIKPGYIMTNAPCGYLKMSYSTIPTDEDGYVLIPDNPAYMEAIYWYIASKIGFQRYVKGEMNQRVYYDMKTSWNFYCKQAYAEAMLPNEDEMESIKNSWNKLMPELNAHSKFYSTVGERQRIYNVN